MTDSEFGFAIGLTGRAAGAALSRPGRGRAVAVFRRSFYVETAPGALACIGPPSLGAGPLNALCDLPDRLDWAASGLRADAAVRVDGGRLRVGGRMTFDFDGSRDWRPPPPGGWTRATLSRGLDALAQAALSYRHGEGLGALVCGGERARRAADPLLRAAASSIAPLIEWLADALANGPAGPPDAAAAGLIGLGPGLTPSGDDYVGGAMVALRTLGREGVADRLAAWALPLARRRTGEISAAHLACAAEGEGAQALHAAIAVLCSGGTPGLAGCLRDIDAIGHTSGWDALAGAVAVMGAMRAAPG